MQNPRTRLVSLRMTEEEYDRLRNASEDQGARSVSEFARNTLLAARSHAAPAGYCRCQTLSALDERLGKVEQEVADVKEQLLCHIHSEYKTQSAQ